MDLTMINAFIAEIRYIKHNEEFRPRVKLFNLFIHHNIEGEKSCKNAIKTSNTSKKSTQDKKCTTF